MKQLKGYTLMLALVVIIVITSIAVLFLSYFRINYFYINSAELGIKSANYCYEGFSLLNSDISDDRERKINFPDGIQLVLQVKKWGLYDLYYSTSKRQPNDTLFSKIALVGYQKNDTTNIALYLRRNNAALYVGDSVSITSNCYLPMGAIKGMNIAGQRKIDKELLHHSVDTIVSLRSIESVLSWLKSYEIEHRGKFTIEDSISTSFKSPTTVFSYDTVVVNNAVHGNVIIRADHVALKQGAEVNEAIIIANSVSVPDQFYGRVQIFAANYIDIGSGAIFDYPSTLTLLPEMQPNTSSASSHSYINASDGFELYGELYAYAFSYSISKNIFISLKKQSRIMGSIYSTGSLTWEGKCNGAIICERLLNYNGGALQTNFLKNSEIDTISRIFSYSNLYPYPGRKKIVSFVE